MKLRTIKMLSSISALLVCLYSCGVVESEDVVPSELVTDYTLIYSEVFDRTEACASIRTRGNQFESEDVNLNPPSHVSFNLECLETEIASDEYCADFDGYVDEGIFRFALSTNNRVGELEYENAVILQPIQVSDLRPIVRGQPYEFQLVGTSLNVGDEIEIEINSRITSITIQENNQPISIGGSDTSVIPGDNVRVLIRRTTRTESINTPSEGFIATTYEAVQFFDVQ